MIRSLDPVDIKNKFLQAKSERKGAFIENAYEDVPSWTDFLTCIFEEVQVANPQLAQNMEYGSDVNERPLGNVIVTEDYYFSPQVCELNKYFKTALPLYDYFKNSVGLHFALSGPKVSLGPRYVAPHNDKWDAFTLQCQGTTTWTLTDPETKEKVEYFMKPGDILFFPQEIHHEISCTEPRAGLVFNHPNINNEKLDYRSI